MWSGIHEYGKNIVLLKTSVKLRSHLCKEILELFNKTINNCQTLKFIILAEIPSIGWRDYEMAKFHQSSDTLNNSQRFSSVVYTFCRFSWNFLKAREK